MKGESINMTGEGNKEKKHRVGGVSYNSLLRHDSFVLTVFPGGKLVFGQNARKAAMMASTESDLVRCSAWKTLRVWS